MCARKSSSSLPSPEQVNAIKTLAEERIANCLSTKPQHRETLSRAVCEYYKLSPNEPPKMLFCRSPFEACTLYAVLCLLVEGSLTSSTWADLKTFVKEGWWQDAIETASQQIDLKDLPDMLSFIPKEAVIPFTKQYSLDFPLRLLFQSMQIERLRTKMQSTFSIEFRNLAMPLLLQQIDRTDINAAGVRFGNLRLQMRAHLIDEFSKRRAASIKPLLKKLSKAPEPRPTVRDKMGIGYFNEIPDRVSFVSLAMLWTAPYIATSKLFGLSSFGRQAQRYLQVCEDLSSSAFACIFLNGLCIASDNPISISLDEEGRLHNAEAAALAFKDGYRVYSWHGANLPPEAILHPDSITPETILDESNVTVRRALIDRYGFSRFVLDAGAEQVHSDDFGTLFKVQIPGDEVLMLVKVVNSTPEPDGTYTNYFLRVPPNMRTAKQAVAWTFSMSAEEYDLAFQS